MNNAKIATLKTFAEIDAARDANRKDGRIMNAALDRRLIAREREIAAHMLDFSIEVAATTGELRKWAEAL